MDKQSLWNSTGVSIYSYDALCEIHDDDVHSYCQAARKRASGIAKAWSQAAATEWAMRNYLAVKMILASQLLFNAAAYAERKNLRLVQPYLMYYGMLNTCRAFLFSDLAVDWGAGRMRNESHNWIRNTTVNSIKRLSQSTAMELDSLMQRAKKQRELFSYSFPALGPRIVPGGFLRIDPTCRVAQLLCELAEMNSECLDTAWETHSNQAFEPEWFLLQDLLNYDAGVPVSDRDDHHRLGRLSKLSRPVCLVSMASQGLIDDFVGAWCPSDDLGIDDFNPDQGESPSIFEFF